MANTYICILCVIVNKAEKADERRLACNILKCFDTIMTETQESMLSENITFKKKKTKQLRKRTDSSEESNHSEEEDNDVR